MQHNRKAPTGTKCPFGVSGARHDVARCGRSAHEKTRLFRAGLFKE
jgi:hypothetical protein